MSEPESEEKPLNVCSRENFSDFCKTQNKTLVFVGVDKTKGFVKKFRDEAVQKDLHVTEFNVDSQCELSDDLDLKGKPVALLIKDGEVKDRLYLDNDEVKDTVGLIKMLSNQKDQCNAAFAVEKSRWNIKLESSPQCERTLSELNNLGDASKKNLKRHMK